jgi:hypothetical protein
MGVLLIRNVAALVLLLLLLVCWQRLFADAPMYLVGIEVGLGLKPLIYIFDSHPHEIVDIARSSKNAFLRGHINN